MDASRELNGPCRAALVTPTGRGAIATIEVLGDDATAMVHDFFVSASGLRGNELPIDRIALGRWSHGKEVGEELVVCRRSPQQFEIHCHGGLAAANTILSSLQSRGCRVVPWNELLPALCSDPIATDAWTALAAARTERTAAILLDQYHGALRRALLEIALQIERGEFVAAKNELQTLLQRAAIGRHLTQPWRIVLAGPPNVGKSSLINALLGYQRSIVFDQPGTTRDVVTAHAVFDGWPVELSDTAGLRDTSDAIESAGVARARQQLAQADFVLLVFDAPEVAAHTNQQLHLSSPEAQGANTIVVLNKSDLVTDAAGRAALAAAHPDALLTSAARGDGIRELIERLVSKMVPEAPAAQNAVPFSPHHETAIRGALAELSDPQRGDSGRAHNALRWIQGLLAGKAASGA